MIPMRFPVERKQGRYRFADAGSLAGKTVVAAANDRRINQVDNRVLHWASEPVKPGRQHATLRLARHAMNHRGNHSPHLGRTDASGNSQSLP